MTEESPLSVQALVDVMLDRARESAPGVEYVIMMSAENTLLLPRHAAHIERHEQQGHGEYRGHAYRDHLVEGFIDLSPDAVYLSPLVDGGAASKSAPNFFGSLRSGDVTEVD